jgi:hypothetical protein
MRKYNTLNAKQLWESNFLRILLTKNPKLRWKLKREIIDDLYLKGLEVSNAVLIYLGGA